MARVLLLAREPALEPLLVASGHAIVRSKNLPHDLVIADAPFESARPVIVCTDVGDVEARIRALDLGAVDAFDSGFAHSQIAARVGAVAKRAAPDRIEADGCAIDLGALTATREEKVTALTSREIEIVRWLHRHRTRVVSRAELLEHVWGVSPENTTRAVDVAISALRAKIERDPRSPVIIRSIKNAGYRFAE